MKTAFQKVINSSHEMKKFGASIARTCGRGDVICLSGDLGTGKTQFSQGFVQQLVMDDKMRVPSPSFLLDNTYNSLFEHSKNVTVHHMDLYRLNMDVSSLARLQIPELFKENICLIEWANKLLDYNDLHGIIDPSKVPMLLIHINYMTMRQHHLEDEDSEPRLVQISTQHPLWANRLTNPKINP